jgi:hypothetical protein
LSAGGNTGLTEKIEGEKREREKKVNDRNKKGIDPPHQSLSIHTANNKIFWDIFFSRQSAIFDRHR